MPRHDESDFLKQVLKGDLDAVRFCQMLFYVSQVMDDLIDGDNEVTGTNVVDAFWTCLIDMPGNPFYRQHEPELRPMMTMAMQDYVDSVAMEGGESERLRIAAFALRDSLTGVVIQCARLVGGYNWMRSVSLAVRDHFYEDEYPDYAASVPALASTETVQ